MSDDNFHETVMHVDEEYDFFCLQEQEPTTCLTASQLQASSS